jgi:hypothetical protein
LKCDEKESVRPAPFKPTSPLVIVCEGFQDAGFVCALLRHLKIDNCDVTYPKKRRDGANGNSGIPAMVQLLSAEPIVNGIALLWDADLNADDSFRDACAAFVAPFHAPKNKFSVETHKDRSTGIFMMPGDGQTGTLEHLLLKAVLAKHPDLSQCVENFGNCYPRGANWAANKKAKRDMHCVVAAFCEDDPGCSLGFIWHKKQDNPIDLANPAFKELSDFLAAFSAAI